VTCRAMVLAVSWLLVDASQNVPPAVTIRNADGSVYGSLRLSAAGDALLLSWQGKEGPFGECADEEVQRVLSSSGAEAILQDRNCGASVDFARRVVIRSGSQSQLVAVFEGRPRVAVSWSAATLHIRHSPLPAEQIFTQEKSVGPHRIIYAIEGAPVPPTEYVDFAIFNYGATGRAAGLPLELLQRAAGWAQQASGVHRPEWGTWFGDYPYGDDPRGRMKLTEGAEYYESKYRTKRPD
jgi:hypothetical protein